MSFKRATHSVLLIAALTGASARASAGAPPAYLIEPGDAPANSVPIDPNTPTSPTAPPTDVAEPDDGTVSDGADLENVPLESGEAPPPAPQQAAPPADGAPAPPPPVADDDIRAIDDFRAQLDPYGSWMDDPSYGTVWVPDSTIVGMDFAPYLSSGHWILDTGGNRSWVSDYPFGDVVFHYGRWVWSSRGWAWIAGYTYAPAWVAWRIPTDAYAYYGWAPLPPDFIWVNRAPASLSWRSSYYWLFCSNNFLFASTPSLYVVRSPADARSLAHHTRPYFGAVPRRVSVTTTVATRLPYRPLSPLPPPAGAVRYIATRRATAGRGAVPVGVAHPATSVPRAVPRAAPARAPGGMRVAPTKTRRTR